MSDSLQAYNNDKLWAKALSRWVFWICFTIILYHCISYVPRIIDHVRISAADLKDAVRFNSN